MITRALGRFSVWLEKTIDADERYICASCEDRFPGRSAAIEHVIHCHPEFAGVYANESAGREQSPETCPRGLMPGTALPLVPAAGWS